jgi:hypothetical protein
MRAIAISTTVVLALALVASPARAETDPSAGDVPDGDVQFQLERSRTKKQRVVILSLLGGAAVFGGVGLLFHLDSRSASDEVSAVGAHTGRVYDAALDDTRNRALRSRNLAIAGYAVGGAALVGALVAVIITEPGTEVFTVGTEAATPVSLAPRPGGFVVEKAWRF